MRLFNIFAPLLLLIPALSGTCAHEKDDDIMISDNTSYNFGQKIAVINNNLLEEISGMAPSTRYTDCFWVHNDSGGEATLYLINLSGGIVASLSLPISNRDWEAIAIADGYLYIGEVGDNGAIYTNKMIYKVAEPTTIDTTQTGQSFAAESFETMRFNFADGKRDCETMMYDPISGELVLVSKREEQVRVYTTPFVATSSDQTILISQCATLDFTLATAGDISPEGDKILIKNYDNIFFWHRESSESIAEALSKEPIVLAYDPEPQGEAIAWSTYQDAFYTISEVSWNTHTAIYIYTRVEE